MADLKFVYTVYIRTTPEKIWEALTTPEITKTFWFGVEQRSDWKVGSPWALVRDGNDVWDSGEIVEIEPAKRLVVNWRHVKNAEMQATGETRMSMDMEPDGNTVKLTVTHEIPAGGEAFLKAVSGGWPRLLSSLKSLLETGKPLPEDI